MRLYIARTGRQGSSTSLFLQTVEVAEIFAAVRVRIGVEPVVAEGGEPCRRRPGTGGSSPAVAGGLGRARLFEVRAAGPHFDRAEIARAVRAHVDWRP